MIRRKNLIHAEGINDEKFNQTRFLLVGKMELPIQNCEYKTSINFSTENKSGALFPAIM